MVWMINLIDPLRHSSIDPLVIDRTSLRSSEKREHQTNRDGREKRGR